MNGAEGRLDRRDVLKGAGLIGAAALAALVPAGVAADDHQTAGNAGVQGTWLVDVFPAADINPPPPSKVLITYAQGGSVVATGNDAPGALLGSWSHANANHAGFTFEGFAFAGGHFIGTARVRGVAIYNPETDTISGPARIEFQLAQPGSTFSVTGSTTFTGSRIVVLPL